VPSQIVVELSASEQAKIREQMRRLRLLCPLLRLHIVLLLARGCSPTEISHWLLCSRSTVYEGAACWRQDWRPGQSEEPEQNISAIGLAPSLCRGLLVLLNKSPAAYGWCRVRWSCATLALSLQSRRGIQVSAETVQRWMHQLGWRWKRAKLVAKDTDPERCGKLAQIRFVWKTLHSREALLFADELDIHLLAKAGYQWMPKGTQVEVMTPGKNEKHYLAGAWDSGTGKVHPCFAPRKTNQFFRDLLDRLEIRYPARRYDRIYVVVDNYRIHHAKPVQAWLAAHPRFQLLWLSTYCPRANPIERIFGDTHDKVSPAITNGNDYVISCLM
jgi:transposase